MNKVRIVQIGEKLNVTVESDNRKDAIEFFSRMENTNEILEYLVREVKEEDDEDCEIKELIDKLASLAKELNTETIELIANSLNQVLKERK